VRLLKNIFRVGLFENPYVDPEQTKSTVGNPAFVREGYQTQVKSIVMLKNGKKTMPVTKGKTVYIPKRVIPSTRDWFGNKTQEKIEFPANLDVVKKYYNVTEDPSKADFAIVFVQSPNGGVGYDLDDRKNGGNGYLPISLQYGPYKAEYARENSIAAGDPVIDPTITNRSYKNKTITATNEADLKSILDTRAAMKGKPVIVAIAASKPMVFQEFEQQVDGILVGFGVQQQAMFDIISGAAEPSGLLPVQMPANMKTGMTDIPIATS